MRSKVSLGLNINHSYAALSFIENPGKLWKQAAFKVIEREDGQDYLFSSDLAERIHEEIISVEHRIGRRVSETYLSLPLNYIEKKAGFSRRILHPKHPVQVTEKQVHLSLEQSRLLSVDWDYKCIESFPLEFTLDGKVFKHPPLGIYGRRFDVKSVHYACREESVFNIDKFFQLTGMRCAKLVLSPLAEAGFMPEKDLEKGNFILLNLGKSKLEMSYFDNFILSDTEVLSLSGDAVDEDLSKELNLPKTLSEEVKLSYGSLEKSALEDSRQVTVKRVSVYRQFGLGRINSVLLSSYQRIISEINRSLSEKGWIKNADFAVVLGGGFKIKGIKELIEKELSLPVKVPGDIPSVSEDNKDKLISAAGALKFPFTKFNFKKTFKFPSNILRRIINLWDEYF